MAGIVPGTGAEGLEKRLGGQDRCMLVGGLGSICVHGCQHTECVELMFQSMLIDCQSLVHMILSAKTSTVYFGAVGLLAFSLSSTVM